MKCKYLPHFLSLDVYTLVHTHKLYNSFCSFLSIFFSFISFEINHFCMQFREMNLIQSFVLIALYKCVTYTFFSVCMFWILCTHQHIHWKTTFTCCFTVWHINFFFAAVAATSSNGKINHHNNRTPKNFNGRCILCLVRTRALIRATLMK